jgi:Mn2+/Fe2+ NRAMP family transporter
MNNYLKMFLVSIIIVAILGIMKEYIRQKFCYTRKIHVEFIFWPFGTILTAISTYLGNTFSLASYGLVEENAEDEKNFGKIAFITSLFTLLIALSAYAANIIYPSIILQLVYVYAILAAFIDMFPMNPMGGNDMRKWNFKLWMFMYIIIIVCYVFMSFTQYI